MKKDSVIDQTHQQDVPALKITRTFEQAQKEKRGVLIPYFMCGYPTAEQSRNIILVEPYYEGVLVPDIIAAMQHTPVRIETIGVPHRLLTHYGTPEQHDQSIGFTPNVIRSRIEHFLQP